MSGGIGTGVGLALLEMGENIATDDEPDGLGWGEGDGLGDGARLETADDAVALEAMPLDGTEDGGVLEPGRLDALPLELGSGEEGAPLEGAGLGEEGGVKGEPLDTPGEDGRGEDDAGNPEEGPCDELPGTIGDDEPGAAGDEEPGTVEEVAPDAELETAGTTGGQYSGVKKKRE